MTLRDYQQDCLRAVSAAWKRGVCRQLIVICTGGGKTKLSTGIPAAIGLPHNKRILFLNHLEELVKQSAATFADCLPDRTVGIEKAEQRSGDANIVIGSVPTLGRGGKRLDRFDPDQFGLIIGDELHHAGNSQQWRKILRHFRVLKGEDPDESKLFVGMTATPRRTDKVGLECLCDEIVYDYSWIRGVRDHWLVEPKCHIVETEVDLSEIAKRAGDFALNELQNKVNTRARNELVAQKWHELTPDCPSLFFTVDVQHSLDLAEVLRESGIDCWAVSGDETRTPGASMLIQAFRDGEILGLVSCGKISEGFDAPRATAGYLCRPTMSNLLLQQQLGRVLRPYPSPEDLDRMSARGERPEWIKHCAIVVDFVDICRRHSLVTTPTLIGLKPNFDCKGQSVIEVDQQVRELEAKNPTLDLRSQTSLDQIKSSIQSFDLMQAPELPGELRRATRLAWFREPSGRYHLGLLDGTILSVGEDVLGNWQIFRHKHGLRTLLATARTLQEGIAKAETHVPAEDARVLENKAPWRGEPASSAQAFHVWNNDPSVRSRFKRREDFALYCLEQYHAGDMSYSKGSLSSRIDRLSLSRSGAGR